MRQQHTLDQNEQRMYLALTNLQGMMYALENQTPAQMVGDAGYIRTQLSEALMLVDAVWRERKADDRQTGVA